jgi:hypothetical protein
VCGSGAEQGFAGILEPGSTITIGQTSNTFDSKHTLRYGGVYPGDNVVDCVDDPDTAELSFTNAGDANVPVFFVVDAFSSSGGGDFVVAWSGDIVAGGEFLWEYFILISGLFVAPFLLNCIRCMKTATHMFTFLASNSRHPRACRGKLCRRKCLHWRRSTGMC